MMKKQYIQPAHEQMMATIETFIAASIQVINDSQDNISGDVKEYNGWDDEE
jgi:hypothetical protein